MHDITPDILKRASQGEIGAFEEVYRTFSNFVFNVAFRINQNSADAEEVTQDVFMKIYHNLKSFQFRSTFKTWLYRVTVNTALNYYRKSRRERKDRVDYDNVVDSLAAERSTAEEVIQGDNETRLQELLKILSPKYKACLVLREIEGLSYQEIAASLKIPINTVRSRLKRARQALLGIGKKER